MLRSDNITTSLPGEVNRALQQQSSIVGTITAFSDAQVRLSVTLQEILLQLYTKQRLPRTWAQTHRVIMSMMAELDDWSVEATSQLSEENHMIPNHQLHRTMLRKQYCRTKILITRPALYHVERCFATGIDELTPFDREVAEACIQTAQEVASLLPDEVDLKLVYENGPWWTMTHNSKYKWSTPKCDPSFIPHTCIHANVELVMQALVVLLVGTYCRPYFESFYADSVASVRKLVIWLGCMRETNETARRAYQVVHNTVSAGNLTDPHMWKDIEGSFYHQSMPHQSQVYMPWVGEQQPLHENQSAAPYVYYSMGHAGEPARS